MSGKNRTFFFFSYEGLRLRQPKVGVTQVPSVAARQNAPQGIKPFLNGYPVPSGSTLANNLANFSASYSDPSSLDSTSIRIDHAVNSKLTVFARYNYAPSGDNERGGSGFSLNTVERIEVNTQTLTLGLPWAINPRVMNDFRANWSRARGSTQFMLDNFGGATPPPDSIIFPPFASSKDSLFFFAPLGFSGSFLASGKNANNTQAQINIVDSVSVTKDSHSSKFGVDYRKLSPELNLFNYFLAPLFFSGITGALTGIAVTAGKSYVFDSLAALISCDVVPPHAWAKASDQLSIAVWPPFA